MKTFHIAVIILSSTRASAMETWGEEVSGGNDHYSYFCEFILSVHANAPVPVYPCRRLFRFNSNERARLRFLFLHPALLKAQEESRVMLDAQWRNERFEEADFETGGCAAEADALAVCFDFVKEADPDGCWNCAVPEEDSMPDSCDEYCRGTEECRSDTCHSGSACLSQFYEALNCVLTGSDLPVECNCDKSTGAELRASYLRGR